MAQSVTFNGSSQYATRTLANASPYTSVGSWRLEMRLTDIGAGTSQKIVDNSHFYVKINASTGTLTVFSWDSEITDTTLNVSGFSGHLSDVTIRVQRDVANSRYTIEAWDSNTATRFATGLGPATSMVNRNFGNDNFYIGARSIENSGSAGEFFNGRIAFVRWYSTLVDYTSVSKPTLYANTADLLQMEFESDLNDSSLNAQNFTGTGSPTFNTTPTINPIANAGTDVGGRIAGVTFTLDASSSSAGDAGPITSYSWTRLSGSGTISSASSAQTDVTGISAGQSTFQVQVSDGTNSSTDTVDVGVVAVNADGTVSISDSGIALIVGPIVPYGSAASEVMPYYDVNQENSYVTHRNIPTVAPRSNPSGTIAVLNGSATVTGTGTLFTKEIAAGSPSGATIPLYIFDGSVQTLRLGGTPTGGNVTLVFSGQTTGTITFNASAASIQTALEALSNIAPGDISVTGGPWPSTVTVTFLGTGAYSTDVPRITLGTNSLTGGDAPTLATALTHYTQTEIASVDSDTQITLTAPFTGITASGNGADYDQNQGQEAENFVGYWNYYDAPLTAYIAAYRTGLTKWFDEGDRLAAAWWTRESYNYGAAAVDNASAPRESALGGLMIAGLRGRTEYWDFLNRYVDYQFRSVWVLPRKDYPGLYFGARDPGYSLLYAVWLSQVLPDSYPLYGNGTLAASTGTETGGATLRAAWLSDSLIGALNYFARVQRPDGSLRWLDDWDFSATDPDPAVDGFAEQSFHVGVGIGHAWSDLLRILDGNATYQAEFNTLRQCILMSAAEVMSIGYSTAPVTDTPSKNSRFVFYESWSKARWGATSMPDSLPAWPTIADLPDARQNIVTFTHMLGAAYHYSGSQQYKDWLDEVLSACWGKTGYEGTIGTSDGTGALMDYFSPGGDRRLKEYNEWNRAVGRAFAWRYVTPQSLDAPIVAVGPDRIFANGTTNPQFTARAIDPAGGSLSYQWAAGVGSPTLSGATTPTVTVTSALVNDTFYSLKCAVTNSAGKTTWEEVNFRTSGTDTELRPPDANVASQSVSISGTSSSTALDASASVAYGGRSLHYRWYQTSGPSSVISNTKAANPGLSGLTPGTYTYRVFVYDNAARTVEETGTDAIDIRVSVASGGSPTPSVRLIAICT